MFNCNLQQAAQVWPQISGILPVPHTDDEYEQSTLAANGNGKLKRRYTIERIGDIIEGTYARVLRRQGTKRSTNV